MEAKSNKEIDISVIIPIYNEQQIIDELYTRLQQTISQISENYELIFVNDGSKDHSLLELLKLTEKDHRVFYINFSRNFGHQIAVTADRKSTRLNSSHVRISYAVFCLKKKNKDTVIIMTSNLWSDQIRKHF